MTDPLSDLRRADAHARWIAADSLALRPDAAAQIAAGPVLFAGYMDDDDKPGYEVDRGVAVVTIEGALMDRAGWWWDGYDAIQSRVAAAHADARVRAVVLDITSPGGMVSGLLDAMRALRASRAASGKRMVAWVGSGAFSAAYGLASTCDEIVASDTAGAGSVGVIAALMSRVDQLAQDGIDVRVVSSGTEKTDGHPAVAISAAAEGRLRARVDELAAMLFAEVGIGRPMLTAAVLAALDGGIRYGRSRGRGGAGRPHHHPRRAALRAPGHPSNHRPDAGHQQRHGREDQDHAGHHHRGPDGRHRRDRPRGRRARPPLAARADHGHRPAPFG
jgi:ClpP class serine protease